MYFFAAFLCLHCMRREAEVKIDFKTWGSVFTAGLTGVTGTECKTFVKDFQNQKLPSWLVLSFNLLLLGSQLCGDHLRDHDAEPLDARLLQPTRPTVSGTWGFQSKSKQIQSIEGNPATSFDRDSFCTADNPASCPCSCNRCKSRTFGFNIISSLWFYLYQGLPRPLSPFQIRFGCFRSGLEQNLKINFC